MSRNLLNRAIELTGLDQKFWMTLETGGYGDAATNSPGVPTSGACGHMTGNLTLSIPRADAAYRSGRSVATRLSGKREVKWTMETYIIPGTPDGSNHPTLPDAHPMLLTAFGKYALGSTLVYSLAANTPTSFRLLEEGTHFSRLAVGCVCDGVTFNLPGDGKASMKFDGFAQDMYGAMQSTLASVLTAGNVAAVATGTGGRFDVGSYIDIIDGTDGNTSKATTARKVTGVAGDNVTFDGAPVTAAIGDIMIGYAPDYAPIDASNAMLGLTGTFSTANMGTVSAQLLKAEISIKNSYTTKTQMYGTNKKQGFIADKRRAVSVKMDVLLTRDNIEFYTNNKKFIVDDLTITLAPDNGAGATGRTMTFSMPRVEFNVPDLQQPADGFIKLSLDGICLSTDANTPNTELTLTVS